MSCELISGYELQFSSSLSQLVLPPSAHQENSSVIRRVGAHGTFYITKDEDKLGGSGETYVRVLNTIIINFDDVLSYNTGHLILLLFRFGPFTLLEWDFGALLYPLVRH